MKQEDNEFPLDDGRKVVKVLTAIQRIKRGISKEQILKEYGLTAMKIDTQVLKEPAPEYSISYYKESWEIINGGDDNGKNINGED